MPEFNTNLSIDDLKIIITTLHGQAAEIRKTGDPASMAFSMDAIVGNLTATLAQETGTGPTHTPGPWYRDHDGFIKSNCGETIADFDCASNMDIGEREANKALAIASPDLLAALESLMPLWEREDATDGAWNEEFEAAEQAISKARN